MRGRCVECVGEKEVLFACYLMKDGVEEKARGGKGKEGKWGEKVTVGREGEGEMKDSVKDDGQR